MESQKLFIKSKLVNLNSFRFSAYPNRKQNVCMASKWQLDQSPKEIKVFLVTV